MCHASHLDQIACFVGPTTTQIKPSQMEYGADYRPESCARLQLVFVHAENDTTMPWGETEALFKLTLAAAAETTSPRDGVPKDLKVVDLGEAGRQEVWQAGSKCIQKTIAKHGGKRPSSRCPSSVLVLHASAAVPQFLCYTATTGQPHLFVF